jgi:hypothetical protein
VSDQRIIDCARSGTWGLGDCPTREQLVARMSRAGQVAFTSPPAQMNLGDSYVIHVAAGLGQDMAASAIREAAGSETNIAQQNVALLPSLEAELTGVGFDIRPLQSDARQTLLNDRPNEWSWEVRPRQEGARRLTLTVWGLLSFGDERFPRIRVQTLRHDVNVTVSMPTRLRIAGEWAVSHWEASAGAGGALLALLTWMMTRLRRRSSGSA